MDTVVQDLRYALRLLRRNPAFTTVVVLTLTLGMGANTAIFTLIDAVILRHIPVRHPEQLIALGNTARVGSLSQGSPRTDLFSYPLYRDLRDRNTLVSGLVARSEEHTSELQSQSNLVCRLLLEKKKKK